MIKVYLTLFFLMIFSIDSYARGSGKGGGGGGSSRSSYTYKSSRYDYSYPSYYPSTPSSSSSTPSSYDNEVISNPSKESDVGANHKKSNIYLVILLITIIMALFIFLTFIAVPVFLKHKKRTRVKTSDEVEIDGVFVRSDGDGYVRFSRNFYEDKTTKSTN